MAAGTLALSDAYSGAEALLQWVAIWHTDDTGAAHVYRFATVDLDDPITYHGGFKDARLLDVDWFRGSTSPLEMGQWQSSTLRVVLSDYDQFFRRTFGNSYGTKLRGRRDCALSDQAVGLAGEERSADCVARPGRRRRADGELAD